MRNRKSSTASLSDPPDQEHGNPLKLVGKTKKNLANAIGAGIRPSSPKTQNNGFCTFILGRSIITRTFFWVGRA